MKITPTSLTISQLLGSPNEQFVVPTYQRRYSWRQRQVYELLEDIYYIEEAETHLLGSIVCLTGPHTAGMNRLELVDGQQRLTTVTILLECLRRRFVRDKESQQAADLARLLCAKPLGGKQMDKVALGSKDATEFARLIQADTEPEQTEFENEHLRTAFNTIQEWLDDCDSEQVATFLYKLLNNALIIRLDVSEAKDAFKLFETINNRGLKLSPTDIIKNFVLGNAARFGTAQLNDARNEWARLITYLDGTDTDAFFRHFLSSSLQQRVTKSKVVADFKKMFMNEVKEAEKLSDRHLYIDIDSEEHDDTSELDDIQLKSDKKPQLNFKTFLRRVVKSAEIFGKLVLANTGNVIIDRHLRNLRLIKAAQSFGFLMRIRVEGLEDKQFIAVLKMTENLMLRRHICRERTNETESLFANLCGFDSVNAVAETKKAYRQSCPSDEKFKTHFADADFSANIERARYCLEQIEMTRHGKHSELQVLGPDEVHVEHIIPQKIKTKKAKDEFGDWIEYLGENAESLHSKFVSKIGNLTIFSGALNIGASNNPFTRKKGAYAKSSIEITKELTEFPSFKFKQVVSRSKALADEAVKLWPTP